MINISSDVYCKRTLLLPSKVVHWYLAAVIILYLFGPLEWHTQNKLFFYSFITLAQFLLYYGFKNTVNSLSSKPLTSIVSVDEKYVLKFLKIMIAVNLLFVFLNMIRYAGVTPFSWDLLFKKLYLGITSPAQQYREKFTPNVFGGQLLTYSTVVLSPFLWPVIPLSLLFFNKLSVINKILLFLTLFFECARWIAIGTNKGIIDVVLIIASVLLIKHLQNKFRSNEITQTRSIKPIGTYILIIILFFIGLFYFINTIGSRVADNWVSISNALGGVQINFESPLMKITPEFLKPAMIFITSYLTQGYYGLSLAIGKPFIPMFGVGNSTFLMEIIKRLFNIDLFQYTYQARIAYLGWDPSGNWHSFYLWVANDVHFLGTLVIMFLLGKYFGALCYHSISKKDPVASVLLCMMFILFFYLPLNNQVFSNPPTFMAFWVLSLFWFYKIRFAKSKKIKNSKY
jgi:hypothetical protein